MKTTEFSAAALLFAASVQAFSKGPPPKPKAHIIEGFKWKNPFVGDKLSAFDITCQDSKAFQAKEYILEELSSAPPNGLLPWTNGLKKFFTGREYPGGWEGIDRHLHDRNLLMMEYKDIPTVVKTWVEEQERTDGKGKGLFAVFDKPESDSATIEDVVEVPAADAVDRSKDGDRIAIFAPGALYHVLPLWLADDSNCKVDLVDLERYNASPKTNGVVGWIDHKKDNENKQAEFTIKVAALKTKEEAKSASQAEQPNASEARSEL